jgi:hypothetical protein
MRRTKEVCLVFQARDAERFASFEDRRMWRLLLARLHPDAGGDHDLFAFACAVRDEMSRENRYAKNPTDETRSAAPFLKAWHESMGHWSSGNRDALEDFWTR